MLYNHLKLGRPSHAAARLAGGSSGAGAGGGVRHRGPPARSTDPPSAPLCSPRPGRPATAVAACSWWPS